jgi:hypothetical protein
MSKVGKQLTSHGNSMDALSRPSASNKPMLGDSSDDLCAQSLARMAPTQSVDDLPSINVVWSRHCKMVVYLMNFGVALADSCLPICLLLNNPLLGCLNVSFRKFFVAFVLPLAFRRRLTQ